MQVWMSTGSVEDCESSEIPRSRFQSSDPLIKYLCSFFHHSFYIIKMEKHIFTDKSFKKIKYIN